MIKLNDLEKYYESKAGRTYVLRRITFDVEEGEFITIMGPSGSGKSTLLHILGMLDGAWSGDYYFWDQPVHKLNTKQRNELHKLNIGFVFQDFALLDYLNVLDNILHPYRITSALVLNAEVRERARSLAEEMGISPVLNRHPKDLSQGEKQRAAICRALLTNPKLILADEATGNLDPVNKIKILDLLFQNVELHGATLLAVTHDHELLSRFDRIVDFQHFWHGGTV